MARRPRVEVPGALYHVLARGNERRPIFRDNADREQYLSRLAHYRERFGFALLAYCLMDNHVHLAIEMGKVPVSRIMLALQSSYTQWFNRRHDRVGHLFQGRYKAFLVEKDRYFQALLRYIHRNPVDAGVAARPDTYRWSSDRAYRGTKAPDWLDADRGMSLLAGSRAGAVARYRELMGEPGETYDEVQSVGQVVKGDEDFARRMLEKSDDADIVRKSLRVEAVARRVAAELSLDLSYLRSPSRRRDASQARAIVGHLAKTFAGIPYVRTAKYFHRDGSTLTRDIRAFESALQQSSELRRRVSDLAARL
jgi:putative transposase